MAIGSVNLTSCPSDSDLLAFFRLDLSESQMDAIDQHVETCDQCLMFVDRVGEHSDTIVQALSSMSSTDDDEPAYQQLRSRLLDAPEQVDSTVSIGELTNAYTPRIDPRSRIGEQIGEYQLTAVLGTGANGSVFRARHEKLDREFAIKLLTPSGANVDRSLERFQNELKAIGRLDHPNIVRATNAGEYNGEHFLVMEFVDGIDVSTLVRRNAPLAVADAVEIACQAARGLMLAHEQRMVHRDVKPSNLLFGFDGVVRVLDLGLVSLADDTEAPFNALARGTADYMAPEQWDNYEAVDARADIYSLGCTLFKLLIGHAPFVPLPADCASKMEAHQNAPVASLRVRRSDVPLGLDRVVRRMLNKNPAKRFTSMEAAIEAMVPYSEGSDLGRLADSLLGRSVDPAPEQQTETRAILTRRNVLSGLAVGLAAFWAGKRFLPVKQGPSLQFDTWRPMESTRPKRILSLKPTSQPLLLDPENSAFDIRAKEDSFSIYPMGRPVQSKFEMDTQVSLADGHRAGRAGMFCRYFREKLDFGWNHRFQVIYVDWFADKISVTWSNIDWTFTREDSTASEVLLGDFALTGVQGVQSLNVTLGISPSPVVRCAGHKITDDEWNLSAQGAREVRIAKSDFDKQSGGEIGLFVERSRAVFREPRMKYIK